MAARGPAVLEAGDAAEREWVELAPVRPEERAQEAPERAEPEREEVGPEEAEREAVEREASTPVAAMLRSTRAESTMAGPSRQQIWRVRTE